MLTTVACKLILKLGFESDSVSRLFDSLLKYVFSKGFLKRIENGSLYQGMSLNIYMLILTSVVVPNSAEWR